MCISFNDTAIAADIIIYWRSQYLDLLPPCAPKALQSKNTGIKRKKNIYKILKQMNNVRNGTRKL